jgi:glycosyltransferase involved in cell wall biosynthesis
MNIAVIDVAAESGGALSVLNDFCKAVGKYGKDNQWYIITSTVDIAESENIHNIKFPKVKKSWIHRIIWEKTVFPKLMRKLEIDIVVSLQNNALPKGKWKQAVYFHNVLLLQKKDIFSIWNKQERPYAIYCRFLGPYIRHTWKNADIMFVQTNTVKTQIEQYNIHKKIEVIPPTVLEEFGRTHLPRIRGYVYPASATRYKNYEAIINAEKKLNEEYKTINVLFTIEDSENEYAREIYEKSKEVKGISFIGKQTREKIFELYREYGVIFTSKIESAGLALTEAQVVNTVAVALDYPYAHEILQDYKRGYLADETSLHKAMEEGMSDVNDGMCSYNHKDGWEKMISIILEMNGGM